MGQQVRCRFAAKFQSGGRDFHMGCGAQWEKPQRGSSPTAAFPDKLKIGDQIAPVFLQ